MFSFSSKSDILKISLPNCGQYGGTGCDGAENRDYFLRGAGQETIREHPADMLRYETFA